MMNSRTYGRTGKSVSEIGFGGWQLGNRQDWEAMEEDAAVRLVHEALERGINFLTPLPIMDLAKAKSCLGRL